MRENCALALMRPNPSYPILFHPCCRRHVVLEHGHAPFLETVPFRTIVTFTLLQLALLLGVYGLTWAGIAGILFPVPIMLLVPLRQYVFPRLFSNAHLAELDAMKTEEAAPLPPKEAMRMAELVGLEGSVDEGAVVEDPGEILDREIQGYHVVHHVSEESLRRRISTELVGSSASQVDSEGPPAQRAGAGRQSTEIAPRARSGDDRV
jgi:hypothetical protein